MSKLVTLSQWACTFSSLHFQPTLNEKNSERKQAMKVISRHYARTPPIAPRQPFQSNVLYRKKRYFRGKSQGFGRKEPHFTERCATLTGKRDCQRQAKIDGIFFFPLAQQSLIFAASERKRAKGKEGRMIEWNARYLFPWVSLSHNCWKMVRDWPHRPRSYADFLFVADVSLVYLFTIA